MISRLRERWRALNQRFMALARRERVMLSLTLVIVVLLGGWQLLVTPLIAQKSAIEQRLTSLSDKVHTMEQQREELERKLAKDPNEPLRKRISRLQNRLERYDEKLNELTTALISPTEMVPLLKGMLAQHEGISLRSVNHEPAEPVNLGGNVEDGDSGLYSHPVSVTVTGRFHEVLAYLKALENLDERLGWRSIDYEVIDWPQARIRIRLHTLSLQEEWLGV